MSTGSTKSRDRKTANVARNASPAPATAPPGETASGEISPRVWWIASICVLAAAAFVRLYALELKPLHHDEGVNGFFLTTLYRDGVYHYSPLNYHGPTLYYFALALTKLKATLFGEPGLSTIVIRLVPAFFGIATVWLALHLRRHIGAIGALAAAALIALSPGHVYVSRYFIHEVHFVFFTLGMVVAALRYWETADPVYLMLASISAALLFATKETAFISVAVLGLAWLVTAAYLRLAGKRRGVPWETKPPARREAEARRGGAQAGHAAGTLERFGGYSQLALMAGLALLIFIFINVLFYSSFFTYREGIAGALESLKVWAKTGTKEHGHDWYTYLWWLMQEEAPVLFLGAGGAVLALIRRRNRFAIFAGAWGFGLLAAYSLIPYKTPWLMLSFTVPLAIIGGYAINEIYIWGKGLTSRMAALTLAFAALGVCGTQAVRLNFFRYDDATYPYVYAHTYREFLPLVAKIEQLAERAQTGKQTGVTIAAGEYWPLPWYLREYPGAAFYGNLVDESGQVREVRTPLVIVSDRQEMMESIELQTALGDKYKRVDSYPLRPGVALILYARGDLVEE